MASEVGPITLIREWKRKEYPEISLEEESQRQRYNFIELGFHREKEINLSEEEYFKSLPEFTPQPESFRGRLDFPLLIETRIPIERQCELVHINNRLARLKRNNWPNEIGNKTPDFPHVVWTDEGQRFINWPVQDVRKELMVDERGGTELYGVGLYIAKPHLWKIRSLDLPGTSVGLYNAACLDWWGGVAWLEGRFTGSPPDPRLKFGAMICSRQ